MAQKFVVRTFGCQMNEHDSERIAAQLCAEGMERTTVVEEADVVVLNTCCIRENADNRLYGTLGHLKSVQAAHPGMQIAVGGCLAQSQREAILKRAPFVNAVFGTHNVGRAAALLQSACETGISTLEILDVPVADEDAFPSALRVRPELPYAAWVTIQVGCDNSCAFCIVPAVRGPEQSRPFGDLLGEVQVLATEGTAEVTLLGQNVNSYGRDLTTALRKGPFDDPAQHLVGERWVTDGAHRARPLFGDLLRSIGAIEGIRRVRFTSPHPKDLGAETIAAMAETPEVCEHLHLPVQSGSDRVLKAMRRGYTAERYLERLSSARAAIDDLAVTSDIIVGFPGETEEDFTATLELAAEAGYDSAFTFIFSPRPGTRAAEMTEQFVPEEVIAERFARLKAVVDRSALHTNQARVGRLEEVVVEGVSRRDPGISSGRTRQGKLLHFDEGPHPRPVGTFVEVRVVGAGAHHLIGELTEPGTGELPGPVRRRIPLSVG